jgi:enoyl-CoA hydratase/carnithine racemase
MSDLEYKIDSGVAWIRLNRPESKNSFTLEMIDEWAQRLREAGADPSVGAVVVTGNGGSFCSGVDLVVIEELQKKGDALAWKSLLWDRVHHIAFTLEALDKPVIAAVAGTAVGAGMDMSLMCDMRFAGRSARFCEGYIRIGAVPGDGGCYFLPRLVGSAKALELFLSGEFIDADEALRIGLVNRVAEPEGLDALLAEYTTAITTGAPLTIKAGKRIMQEVLALDADFDADMCRRLILDCFESEDYAEGRKAFMEKRKPVFKGK